MKLKKSLAKTFFVLIAIAALFLIDAIGQYNPLYAVLFCFLPPILALALLLGGKFGTEVEKWDMPDSKIETYYDLTEKKIKRKIKLK